MKREYESDSESSNSSTSHVISKTSSLESEAKSEIEDSHSNTIKQKKKPSKENESESELPRKIIKRTSINEHNYSEPAENISENSVYTKRQKKKNKKNLEKHPKVNSLGENSNESEIGSVQTIKKMKIMTQQNFGAKPPVNNETSEKRSIDMRERDNSEEFERKKKKGGRKKKESEEQCFPVRRKPI